jgi:hypothetical protein
VSSKYIYEQLYNCMIVLGLHAERQRSDVANACS